MNLDMFDRNAHLNKGLNANAVGFSLNRSPTISTEGDTNGDYPQQTAEGGGMILIAARTE